MGRLAPVNPVPPSWERLHKRTLRIRGRALEPGIHRLQTLGQTMEQEQQVGRASMFADVEVTLKLLVFGATGGTGRQIVRLALEQGHQVTAFARSGVRRAAVTPLPANLVVFAGDVLDATMVSEAVAGHDVVISALGTREGDDWILPQATAHICAAMRHGEGRGVRRLICVTTLGVGESRKQLGQTFALLAVDLRETLAEKEAQEQIIRESGLDWIIVRPGALTNGPRMGAYRCVTDPAVALPRALISPPTWRTSFSNTWPATSICGRPSAWLTEGDPYLLRPCGRCVDAAYVG